MKKINVCNEHHEIPVYDNCHCKPPPMGTKHQFCSMLVIVSSHGSFFGAQFVPEEGEWIVHCGSVFGTDNVPKLKIPDRDVEYWFHCPGYEAILESVRREGQTGPNSSARNDVFVNEEVGEESQPRSK